MTYSNSMTAHVWAQGENRVGRSHNNTMYFRGNVLYSYRDSWPLAYIDNEKQIAIINDAYVSSTTRRHLSYAVRAIRSGVRKVYVDDRTFKDILEHIKSPGIYVKLIEYVRRRVDTMIEKAALRRDHIVQRNDLIRAAQFLNDHRHTAKLLKLDAEYATEFDDDIKALENRSDILMTMYRERVLSARAEERAQFLAKVERLSTEFHKYEIKVVPGLNKVLLRVRQGDGKFIETSKGACFPVSDAVEAFKVIERVRKSGQTFIPDRLRLGDFRVNKISNKGDVTAGCHYVEWKEIERLAKELKLI